jgi:hypothetical protein
LHRRAAHATRNAAEAFKAGAAVVDGKRDELIPILARACLETNGMMPFVINSPDGDFEYQAGPALIGDEKVASPAQHKKRQVAAARVIYCFTHIVYGAGFDKVTCRSADL